MASPRSLVGTRRTEPEEAVRQALIAHLVDGLGVPRACIRQELALSTLDPRVRDRVDVAVHAADGSTLRPVLLAECKAPHVPLDELVIAQVRRYLRLVPARWVVLANGPSMLVFRVVDGIWQPSALPATWAELKEA
ncbi:MAG: type I restriction enzyme HsdR N-terminal domain-containing protein [Fibrobacterota bacterium]|nr:type I restriction enzyme HsdR N-terminal domain-containing protein [Fibrobacterota bacterium]QQS05766.1 MAG: type I restriction enzyme HsdR N-terminal domain-containing protein [Fibrobacterota bacterium]